MPWPGLHKWPAKKTGGALKFLFPPASPLWLRCCSSSCLHACPHPCLHACLHRSLHLRPYSCLTHRYSSVRCRPSRCLSSSCARRCLTASLCVHACMRMRMLACLHTFKLFAIFGLNGQYADTHPGSDVYVHIRTAVADGWLLSRSVCRYSRCRRCDCLLLGRKSCRWPSTENGPAPSLSRPGYHGRHTSCAPATQRHMRLSGTDRTGWTRFVVSGFDAVPWCYPQWRSDVALPMAEHISPTKTGNR